MRCPDVRDGGGRVSGLRRTRQATISGVAGDIPDGRPVPGDLGTRDTRSLRDPDHETAAHHAATKHDPTTNVDQDVDSNTDNRADSTPAALGYVLV
jgi:hypothetical protein